MARFTSPYLDPDEPCRWLRGNQHGHSTVSDGQDDPLTIVRAYETRGYDWLALSEHNRLLDPAELQPHTTMCIVPAVEVTACSQQTLMFLSADRALPEGTLTPREIMDKVHALGGLFVFNHPNWRPFKGYATDALLDTMAGLRGMEIYTGVIERCPGRADATDRWDYLLAKGWHVFGHASDDQHRASDQFIAWDWVQWGATEAVDAKGIVQALAEGRSYASTGVTIARVGVMDEGEAVVVDSDADEIHWSVDEGPIVRKDGSGHGTFHVGEVPDESTYLRATCLGHGNATAWTQPFWVRR